MERQQDLPTQKELEEFYKYYDNEFRERRKGKGIVTKQKTEIIEQSKKPSVLSQDITYFRGGLLVGLLSSGLTIAIPYSAYISIQSGDMIPLASCTLAALGTLLFSSGLFVYSDKHDFGVNK